MDSVLYCLDFSSVQFLSCVRLFWLHGLQHVRLPCPSPTPGACSNSCPSSRWCHPTISSSVVPFSSCLQSHPASGSFQMSQFFTWGGQSIEVSANVLTLTQLFINRNLCYLHIFAIINNATVNKYLCISLSANVNLSIR